MENTVTEEELLSVYNLIKDNEVDHLRELLYNFRGVGHLTFDFFQEDEEVLTLSDDSKVTVSMLDPILLSIKSKSFSCLKHLVQSYGIRNSMGSIDIVVKS